MLDRPVVDLINELHWLGRRLAVLKRLYQSYELIMRRLLQRQRMLRDEARSHQPAPLSFGTTFGEREFADLRKDSLMSSGSIPGTTDKPVGVILSSAAAARFERLADRIVLYCLSEIESCLTEKESLTFLVSVLVHGSDRNLGSVYRIGQCADGIPSLEFQFDRAQGLAGRGEIDTDHDPPGQSDDLVPTGQSDDCVLLDGIAGCQGRVHHGGLLGELRGDFRGIHRPADAVRSGQRHGGREDDLSVLGEDVLQVRTGAGSPTLAIDTTGTAGLIKGR